MCDCNEYERLQILCVITQSCMMVYNHYIKATFTASKTSFQILPKLVG